LASPNKFSLRLHRHIERYDSNYGPAVAFWEKREHDVSYSWDNLAWLWFARVGYFAFPRTFSFNGRFGGVWVGILLTTLVTLISVNAAVEAQGGTLGIALLCCTGADCGSHLSCLLLCVRIICWRGWVCVHCICGFNVCNDSFDDCFQSA
jgi:hypothetical protein